MKLWLDDLRPVPYGYESERSVNEAEQLILEAEHNGIEIEALDLDHDLGDYADQGGEYGQPGGESQHGEDSGQILGRTVLVGNFVII